MPKPILYFVAGPNGKSTLINSLLKKEGDIPYVCPDSEAVLLQDIKDDKIREETAWHRARSRRAEYVEKKQTFVTETVFSHASGLLERGEKEWL